MARAGSAFMCTRGARRAELRCRPPAFARQAFLLVRMSLQKRCLFDEIGGERWQMRDRRGEVERGRRRGGSRRRGVCACAVCCTAARTERGSRMRASMARGLPSYVCQSRAPSGANWRSAHARLPLPVRCGSVRGRRERGAAPPSSKNSVMTRFSPMPACAKACFSSRPRALI